MNRTRLSALVVGTLVLGHAGSSFADDPSVSVRVSAETKYPTGAANWCQGLDFDDPWPEESKPRRLGLSAREQVVFKDTRGQFALTRCRTANGDCCNGYTTEALELRVLEAGTWKRVWRSRMYASSYQVEAYDNLGRVLKHVEVADLDGDGVAERLHGVLLNEDERYRVYVQRADGARVIAEVYAPLNRLIDRRFGSISPDDIATHCPTVPSDITFYEVDRHGVTTATSVGEKARNFLPPGYHAHLTALLLDRQHCVLLPN